MKTNLSQTLLQSLIQCQTVAESIDFLKSYLSSLEFTTEVLSFQGVDNLYAYKKLKAYPKTLAFIGHVDVVPAGKNWETPPFSGNIYQKAVWGRGAVDMKGGIACFLAALTQNKTIINNQVILISGDEEGDAQCGMPAVLKALRLQNREPFWDFALIGEPTSQKFIGDHIKIGCRGSLNVYVQVQGLGGHVAYPQFLENPITALINFLHELKIYKFDEGDAIYDSSHIEITQIQTNNNTTNVVPTLAHCRFNIRFNPQTSSDQFVRIIESLAQKYPLVIWKFEYDIASQPFISQSSEFIEKLANSIEKITKNRPKISACGANSDAKFIKEKSAFAELGLNIQEAHKINEKVPLEDLEILTRVYDQFLKDWYNT